MNQRARNAFLYTGLAVGFLILAAGAFYLWVLVIRAVECTCS
jgi:hypothetical protein